MRATPGYVFDENMKAKFKHTDIVAADWRRLARFYEEVFGCAPVPPERHLGGEWLSKGTGVENAQFSGVHLRLPGYGEEGPTLEIYQLSIAPTRKATSSSCSIGERIKGDLDED